MELQVSDVHHHQVKPGQAASVGVPLLRNFSLEITRRDVGQLKTSCSSIVPGTAVSITSLPREGLDDLVSIAETVRDLGLVPVPHLSARRVESRAVLERVLRKLYSAAGVTRVFVIAGDLTSPLGPFQDALAIIQSGLLAGCGINHVGITGYPDGHPKIQDEKLSEAMYSKLAALSAAGHSAEIVTQFAFDCEAVLDWLARIRRKDVNVPVRIGLPGPTTVQSLIRFAAQCGVRASAGVLAKYGVSVAKLFSTATPDTLFRELAEKLNPDIHGQVRIHLYPFGGVAKAIDWATKRVD